VLAVTVAGCSLEPLDKDQCLLTSDCEEGRVCVSGRCRNSSLGFDSDGGSLMVGDAGAGVAVADGEGRDAAEDRQLGSGTPPKNDAPVEDATVRLADAPADVDAGPPDRPGVPIGTQDAAPETGPPGCGDGVRQAGEACDDGNRIDEDGCTDACTLPTCGDGITQAGEECDDGNASDDDRCTKACTWVHFKQIVGQSTGGCALRTNGTVTCWGGATAAWVPPADRFTSIARGDCGVRVDGTIACWGYHWLEPAGRYTQVAVGGQRFVCGVRVDGTNGCEGEPGSAGADPPAGKFTRVAADRDAACAIREDGQVVCWGSDPIVKTGVPTGAFVEISVGGSAACATDAKGKVTCWGGVTSPADLGGPGPVRAVVVDGCYACGIRPEGTPVCWQDTTRACRGGDRSWSGGTDWAAGRYVQINTWPCGIVDSGLITCGFAWQPHDVVSPTAPPERAAYLAPPVRGATAADDGPVCLLGIQGQPRCPGVDSLDPPGPFQQLAATGISYNCGLDFTGHISCWLHPIPDPSGTYRQITGGAYHICALDTEGTVSCWAPPDNLKEVPYHDTILQPPAGAFKAISAGRYQTCGLRPEGAVECWGEMELAASLGPSVFLQLKKPPVGSFEEVAAGFTDSCARTAEGVIRCWGVGPVTTRPAPTGLHGLSVGDVVACGLTADDELQCWGDLTGWIFMPKGPFRSVDVGRRAYAVRRNGTVVAFGAIGAWLSGDHLP
jgi:cysteine-rich repeat protein